MVSKFAAEIIKEIESDTKESAQHIQQLSKPEICPRYSDNGFDPECHGITSSGKMSKYQLYKTAKIKDSGEIVAINFVGIDYTDSEPCYTIRKFGEYGFGTVIYHLLDLSDFVL